MGDVMPDYHVSILKIDKEMASLDLTIRGYRAEILEHRSRIQKAFENWDAANDALAKKKKQRAGLIKEHGEPAVDWDKLRKEALADG